MGHGFMQKPENVTNPTRNLCRRKLFYTYPSLDRKSILNKHTQKNVHGFTIC